MTNKNQFMLLFKFEPSNNYAPTEAEMAEQHQLWGAFIGNIALQEKLVSTHQLGEAGNVVNEAKEITSGIDTIGNLMIGGNMVVTANNLDEATEMAKQCPILLMGGMVEVRSVIPM